MWKPGGPQTLRALRPHQVGKAVRVVDNLLTLQRLIKRNQLTFAGLVMGSRHTHAAPNTAECFTALDVGTGRYVLFYTLIKAKTTKSQ